MPNFIDTKNYGGKKEVAKARAGKNFAFLYFKIHSFELTQAGLEVSKEGKEMLYIIGLDDYDVPCIMISHILNDDKE